ncbi:MAG: hypothetical protein ABI678_04745 [Kofleriaceae bacterium]
MRWKYIVGGVAVLLAVVGGIWFFFPKGKSKDPLVRVVEMQAGLADARHLALEHPIPAEFQRTSEFRQFVRRNVNGDKAKHRAVALTELGLLPAATDLGRAIEDAQVSQAAAYYDPSAKKFFIVMVPKSEQLLDQLAAHELTHGLQDQHFDLKAYLGQPGLDSDASAARRFVVEGDAMFTSIVYLVFEQTHLHTLSDKQLEALHAYLDKLASADITSMAATLKQQAKVNETMDPEIQRAFDAMDKIPPTILVPLLEAYMQGAVVALAGYRYGGWTAVDALYHDPPTSTEQVLHPDRLFGTRDLPHHVTLPTLDGYEVVDSDVLGELQWSVYFSLWKHGANAHPEHDWGGDRYSVLRDKGGKLLTLIATTWDTREAAMAFYDAYLSTLKTRFPDGEPGKSGTADRLSAIWVRRSANRVFIVDGATRDTLDKLAAETTFDLPVATSRPAAH